MNAERLRLVISLSLFSVLTMVVYQNCSQLGGGFDIYNYTGSSLSSTSVDTSHPANELATQSTQKMQIANRGYVAQVLREVFTSGTYPVAGLESLILQWVGKRVSQYGLGCDPYSTYSSQDCGGDISAANLPYTTDDNVVRQSYRVQACDNILGNGNAVNAVLSKLTLTSLAPNADGIRQIYELFYRGDGTPDAVVAALITLDRTLAEAGESTPDRWRAMISVICNSPGWQLL